MKKYNSLSELLSDYRILNNISQVDLAAKMNVDIRTVIRWEANETLIKSEKEEELVDETFIPYQVIRNLNASVAIPTFYDFSLRKYALAELSVELPDADWIKAQMDNPTKRIRTISFESDIDNIIRYAQFLYNTPKPIHKELIREAAKLLPELNLIISDSSGYYSGHCVIFPMSLSTYQKLKDREIIESQLTINDLVDYRKESCPVFHFYDITADCNENVYYLVGDFLKFFRDQPLTDYLVSSLTTRSDSYEINKQLGMNLVWEDREEQESLGTKAPPRFYTGNYKDFLGR